MKSEAFALEFLARMEMGNEWLWSILWTDEANFHLMGYVNTQNCRIWIKEKLFATASVRKHSPNRNCMVRGHGIVYGRAVFFEEIGHVCPVTCTVKDKRNASLLSARSYQHFNSVHVWIESFS